MVPELVGVQRLDHIADAGRPILVGTGEAAPGSTVYIVDSWTPPPAGNLETHDYRNYNL